MQPEPETTEQDQTQRQTISRISILTKKRSLREVLGSVIDGTNGALAVHRSVPCIVELNLPADELPRPWSVTHVPSGALIVAVDTMDQAIQFGLELWESLDESQRLSWLLFQVLDGAVPEQQVPEDVRQWVEHVRVYGYVPLVAKQTA